MNADTIVLTTDLSDPSRRAFAPTVELARSMGLGIRLIHVVLELQAAPHGAPLAPPLASPDTDREVAEAKEQLEKMQAELGDEVPTEVDVLTGENVVEAIVEYARDHGARFIALSTHGRTGLGHLLLGSVAEGVLQRARTPVVCFPQREED